MLQGLFRSLRVPTAKEIGRNSIEKITFERQHHLLNFPPLFSVRLISSARKSETLNVEQNEQTKEHPRAKTLDFKQKIYLKDQFGRMLGLKTRQEADQMAHKNKLVLVEDDATKKIPTLRLMNPRKITIDGEEQESTAGHAESDVEEHAQRKHKGANKQLLFGSKVSDHDLATKIRQVKRWVSKCFETVIRVHSQTSDLDRLEKIFKEFESHFNTETGCKINQKRLTETGLKFNIVPVDKALVKIAFKDVGDEESFEIDMDKIDPNQLLNDEKIIVSKNKK